MVSGHRPRTVKDPGKRPMNIDAAVREHVLNLLKGGGAHIRVEDALKDFQKLRGRRPTRLLIQRGSFWSICALHSGIFWNSAAMLLINHRSSPRVTGQQRKPRRAIKTGMQCETIWEDLESMQRLVEDASIDLYAPIPHGDGQTVLREALLVADHPTSVS